MGRWRAAASILLNHLIKTPFPSPKSLSPKPLSSSNPPLLFRFTRHFSALPSPVSVYATDFDNGSPEFPHQNLGFVSQGGEEEEKHGKIPVKAYFLCTSIDLKSMQAENLSNIIPPSSRSSNYIALRHCDFPPDITGLGMKNKASCFRYMVVFQYGSAVLFNIEDHEVESHLEMVRRHASGLLTEMRRDDYTVKEQPLMTRDMQGGPDYIVLKTLDTDSIRIIGSVLGQSIALDYFVSQVDGMVEGFADINRAMEKTGTFTMDRTELIKLVGKANSNLADVILKVGLFERSEVWSASLICEISLPWLGKHQYRKLLGEKQNMLKYSSTFGRSMR
ncbi:hypothetical protein V6Z11_A05G337300 [Gossypium hirsutum]